MHVQLTQNGELVREDESDESSSLATSLSSRVLSPSNSPTRRPARQDVQLLPSAQLQTAAASLGEAVVNGWGMVD